MASQGASAARSWLRPSYGPQASVVERKSAKGWAITYAAATFLGALLIFQVQPIISKCVLPWFGGTPAVWTTCLLFFQTLLFGGYLYAHLLRTYLSPRAQGLVHACLLIAAALALPIQPADHWQPLGSESPTTTLLVLLAAHVALPYFALSSTGPLIQAWLSYEKSDRSIYRLYALSNVGSLAALLTYPFLVEPFFTVTDQTQMWAFAFCVFGIFMGTLALRLSLRSNRFNGENSFGRGKAKAIPSTSLPATSLPKNVASNISIAWISYPAFASMMLLAVTNHVCQDIAVVPFLWILPLSLYLISFVITFDSPAWYRPKPVAVMTLLAIAATHFASQLSHSVRLPIEVVANMITLLGVCLICHGEVARRQPTTDKITLYYVLISLGGAIGGITVAVLCPLMFDDYRELHYGNLIAVGLAAIAYLSVRKWSFCSDNIREPGWLVTRGITFLVGLVILGSSVAARPQFVDQRRNFFGVLRVDRNEELTWLTHGSVKHGLQLHGDRSMIPTSYYGRESGVGKVLAVLQSRREDLRVGVVGLGCGVLAAYGREGENWDFFEINPDVLSIAQSHFSFLQQSPADIQHHLGDGRILLEKLDSRQYDLLVIDAFSSDSIPAHLLTLEAMQLYRSRLAPSGMIAIHLSNNHLDLIPLAHRLADEVGLESRRVRSRKDDAIRTQVADWMLITGDPSYWQDDSLRDAQRYSAAALAEAPLWTDQHHNLASVVNWFSSKE